MNERVIKNPNFKNTGEFYKSLAAKGVGVKDWTNTHTEVEHLGNGKFAASLSTGHRVFFDKADGNKPKKHKLTDERPAKDYVLIQGSKCCVEVYPYYARYFDVQHEEVRLYEERWVVQRWRDPPANWFDIGAWNPVITVEEYSEPAGDVVKVTVTYDTDYGTLTVEYFQRDGNALKHNVTFKTTSGSPETFRVLQRWAGIVGDKVDGEAITAPTERFKYGFRFEKEGKLQLDENLNSMVPTWQEEAEAARKMWVRVGECNRCGKCCHGCSYFINEQCSVKDHPGLCQEFPWSPEQVAHIPECSYSFEGTGETASPIKLKPTRIDTHPRGLKVDFIYGDWVLAKDESLEIDPDTTTLDNPTEDGHILWEDPNYTRDKTGFDIFPYYSSFYTPDKYYHGYAEWDISGVAVGSTITKVEFRYEGQSDSPGNAQIFAIANQPSVQSDDNAGNQVIYDDAVDGNEYLATGTAFIEQGNTKDVGGASGPAWTLDPKTDVGNALGVGWFAFGFWQNYDGGKLGSVRIKSEEFASTPDPTLYLEYDLPAAPAKKHTFSLDTRPHKRMRFHPNLKLG